MDLAIILICAFIVLVITGLLLWKSMDWEVKRKLYEEEISKLQLANTEKELVQKKAQLKSDEFADKLYKSYAQLSNLDSLLREINTQTDLTSIMSILQNFLVQNFEVPNYVLYIFDSETSHLKLYEANFPDFISKEEQENVRNRQIHVNAENVTKLAHVYAWKRKRAFFIADMDKYDTQGVELENKKSVNLKSLLILPLFLRQKFIGTLDLLDFRQTLSLSSQEVEQLKIIGDYVAGSIESSFLLHELELKTIKIQEEKQSIEKSRRRIETLNGFIRRINSMNHLDEILTEIFRFLKYHHATDLGILLLVDKTTNTLNPVFPSEEVFHKGLIISNTFKNFSAPIKPEIGSLYRTYTTQKPLYARRFSSKMTLSAVDRKFLDNFNLKRVVQIPLVVKNETIGIFALKGHDNELEWNNSDFKDLVSFCDQIAGAIHNANLMEVLAMEKEKTIRFLKNILPGELAEELMEFGEVIPMEYESATILFTDFKNFTTIAETLSPESLIEQLDACFSQFDDISIRYNFEKLKTIGDSYMAAGGIPQGNFTHPVDACLFAMEIQGFMLQIKSVKQMLGVPFWEIRIGVHTGPVVAGVVGKTKFAYDVWGDTVNTASRMESSGEPGEINLSETTYEKVKRFFICEYRGKIKAKNKGEMGMYFLKRLRPEFSRDPDGRVPNTHFLDLYENLKIGAKILWKEAS